MVKSQSGSRGLVLNWQVSCLFVSLPLLIGVKLAKADDCSVESTKADDGSVELAMANSYSVKPTEAASCSVKLADGLPFDPPFRKRLS